MGGLCTLARITGESSPLYSESENAVVPIEHFPRIFRYPNVRRAWMPPMRVVSTENDGTRF